VPYSQSGASISSQQNGDNGSALAELKLEHEGRDPAGGLLSVFAAVAPNTVKQLSLSTLASQHTPICEPVHFGPPGASLAVLQFLPVP